MSSRKNPLSNLNFQQNQQIVIEINDGRSVVGDFHAFTKDRNRIELRDVKDFHSNASLGRVKYFYSSNVVSIKLLSGDAENYQSQNTITTIQLNSQQRIELENVVCNLSVINQVDSNFHNAIEDLLTHSAIGLSIEGAGNIENGRIRELNIITLSTAKAVYIFDLVYLNKINQIKNLKKVLSNPGIIKVVYNSKSLCDNLYHRYKIELKSIFDIFIADSFSNDVTKLKSLKDSLLHNLNMRADFKRPSSNGSEVCYDIFIHTKLSNYFVYF